MNNENTLLARKVLLIFTLIIVLFLMFKIVLYISRIGETKVIVEVAPKDSLVFIDNEPAKAGANYLSPGEYKIVGRKSGFTDAEQKITVGSKSQNVYLLPEANSQQARNYLNNNPDAAKEREQLWDKISYQQGQSTKSKTPIIEYLPYTDIGGYFAIDFGPSDNPKIGTELIVSNSTSEGRQNALKWIRQQGFDPTDYYIKFIDFDNPVGN